MNHYNQLGFIVICSLTIAALTIYRKTSTTRDKMVDTKKDHLTTDKVSIHHQEKMNVAELTRGFERLSLDNIISEKDTEKVEEKVKERPTLREKVVIKGGTKVARSISTKKEKTAKKVNQTKLKEKKVAKGHLNSENKDKAKTKKAKSRYRRKKVVVSKDDSGVSSERKGHYPKRRSGRYTYKHPKTRNRYGPSDNILDKAGYYDDYLTELYPIQAGGHYGPNPFARKISNGRKVSKSKKPMKGVPKSTTPTTVEDKENTTNT